MCFFLCCCICCDSHTYPGFVCPNAEFTASLSDLCADYFNSGNLLPHGCLICQLVCRNQLLFMELPETNYYYICVPMDIYTPRMIIPNRQVTQKLIFSLGFPGECLRRTPLSWRVERAKSTDCLRHAQGKFHRHPNTVQDNIFRWINSSHGVYLVFH